MPNTLILACQKGYKTARKLANIMHADYTKSNAPISKRYNLIFRYGNGYTALATPPNHIVNTMRAINLASNKLDMRIELLRHGINAPRLYNTWNIEGATFPLIARPRIHYKGQDFNMVNTVEVGRNFLQKGYYVQEVIDKATEYRLFILDYKIIRASRKEKKDGDANDMVRNFGNGWIFKYVSVDNLDRALKVYARQSTEVANLGFCAIDCCIDTGGKPWIFELNTAPSLIDSTVEYLARRLKENYGLTF